MRFTTALTLAALAAADVTLTRTVSNLEAGFGGSIDLADPGCTTHDVHGCAAATLAWGTTTLATINITTPKDLDAKSRVTGTIKVTASLVPVNVKVDCAVCGGTAAAPASCSIDLPLGLDPAKIDLDPCPIAAANIQQLSNVTLPDKSPLGLVGATLTGTLSLFDDAGGKVMDVGIKGKVNHK
jgi:hypothetical protein